MIIGEHNHARHHANSGNLDHRGLGDIDTLTVHEFLAQSRMASATLSSLSASHGDVWRRSHLSLHPEASIAGRDDAWWLETLAEYNGHKCRASRFSSPR